MSMWLRLYPRWCQLIILPHIISAWAQVDVFLINEAFVLHHKTIEEYPSHSSELCYKVNYEMTFPGSWQRRPGVQASPDNGLPEIWAEEIKAKGHLRPESDFQRLRSHAAAWSLPWNQRPLSPSFLSLCFPVTPPPVGQHNRRERVASPSDRSTNLCDLQHII